jgi:hypothetical protein
MQKHLYMNKTNKVPDISGHTPAQGAAMKTKRLRLPKFRKMRPFVARVEVLRTFQWGTVTIEKYAVEYTTKKELFMRINRHFGRSERHMHDRLLVKLPKRKKTFYWNFNLAHYCFDHGRLTVNQLVAELIFGEPAGEVAQLAIENEPVMETKKIVASYTVAFPENFTFRGVDYHAGENTFTARIDADFVNNALHPDDLFDAVYADYNRRFGIYDRINGIVPPLDVEFPDPVINEWRAAR